MHKKARTTAKGDVWKILFLYVKCAEIVLVGTMLLKLWTTPALNLTH